MESSKPKWLNKEKSTREKSNKQETRLGKQFGGRKTANSGATFGQNDVVTPEFEIEAKTTESKQFILKIDDLRKMQKKCKFDKIALFIVEYANEGEEVVILHTADFLNLIGVTTLK